MLILERLGKTSQDFDVSSKPILNPWGLAKAKAFTGPWHQTKSASALCHKTTMPERWKKSGAIAAQLFRDIFFGKYQRRPDGKFDLNEIFNDPSRPYRTLTKNSFYKHIEEIADRVDAYKQDGSGLQTEAFRRLCRLHDPPPPEDRAPIEANETGDDDSSFSLQASDESITLGDVDTIESAIRDLNINGDIQDVQVPATPKGKMKKEEKLEAMNQDTFLKYSFSEADGRFGYVYHVPSGFDGTFELSDDGRKVVKKEIMQHWMYDAVAVYERMGLDANNVHVVGLQAAMNEKKKDDIKKWDRIRARTKERSGERRKLSILDTRQNHTSLTMEASRRQMCGSMEQVPVVSGSSFG